MASAHGARAAYNSDHDAALAQQQALVVAVTGAMSATWRLAIATGMSCELGRTRSEAPRFLAAVMKATLPSGWINTPVHAFYVRARALINVRLRST